MLFWNETGDCGADGNVLCDDLVVEHEGWDFHFRVNAFVFFWPAGGTVESVGFDGFEGEPGFVEEDMWEDRAGSWSVVELDFCHLPRVFDLVS